jgi:Holliday junction resolvasome RuvABC endonuclease subunit
VLGLAEGGEVSAKCRSCGAPIEWALTEKGRPIPIDVQPVPDGNILLKMHRGPGEPGTEVVRILALDLATRTGWASWDGERRESGYVDFDVKRGESPGMRYFRFNAWLQPLLEALHPQILVYEQPFVMRSGAAAEITLGFATRAQEACALRGIEHQPVSGSTLKKWTTGRGNAKKPEMVAAVIMRFGMLGGGSTLDHNQADAIALLEYARAELVSASLERSSA